MAVMRSLALIILFAIGVNAVFDSMSVSKNLGRIVRGHDASIGQFPYVVRIHVYCVNGEHLCGAALIGTSWLLTAAHCFDNAMVIEAHLGSLLIDDAKVAYKLPISNIAIHPYYHKDYFFNDIALVKIPPTALCEEIEIVALPKIQPSYPTYDNYVAKGIGWGVINDQETWPYKLQWGHMKILTEEECGSAALTKDVLCTAMSSDWATICIGDSGGPLVLECTGELVGVASSGDAESCERGDPAFFTRVTSYLDWIKSVSGIFYE